MSVATTSRTIGPADHGRRISMKSFESAERCPGYKYELIDGKVYVSPEANFAEHKLEVWFRTVLQEYVFARPDVINFIATKGRVFLPNVGLGSTVPEPDVAVYANVPLHLPARQVQWQLVSPIMVAEVLVDGEFDKDLTRNPALYLRLPSIAEYWVLNGSIDPDEPSLIRHVRRGKRWAIQTHLFGSTITTKLFPGFSLVLDPRRPIR
jgi:Uma2 family endonuclease